MNEKLMASLGTLNLMNLQQINTEYILNIVSSLSLLQALILMIQGSVLITSIKFEGWRDKLPIYLFKCEKHGYQLSYPQGHMRKIVCQKCFQE